MSEIEKLYENAKIKKYQLLDRDNKLKWVYPEFTAEKQFELIKCLAKRLDFGLEYYQDKTWAVQTQLGWDGYEVMYEHKNFDEALSGLINHLWKNLTDTEKAEIKEILK